MTAHPEAPARKPATGAAPEGLVEILLASLETLAAEGQVDAACRLAGRACVALRRTDPAGGRRFDVLLHRLSRQLAW